MFFNTSLANLLFAVSFRRWALLAKYILKKGTASGRLIWISLSDLLNSRCIPDGESRQFLKSNGLVSSLMY